MLESLPKHKMSNNVKDYLSVERISIQEMENSLMNQKSKLLRNYRLSNLLGFKEEGLESSPEGTFESYQSQHVKKQVSLGEDVRPIMKRPTKFKQPFDSYYYRDFLWKIAFSNGLIVEPVDQYEGKLKIYVGPGNNSNLIKGVMKRRTWWSITDKIQDASFVWTQIKAGQMFSSQKKGERLPQITQEENPVPKSKNIKPCPLLNPAEQSKWQKYWKSNMQRQRTIKQSLRLRTKTFNLTETPMPKLRSELKIHNHLINNFIIGNKKALFSTMSQYYTELSKNVFDYLPLTFHIKKGLDDDEYLKFCQSYYSISKAVKQNNNHINKYNAWIVKPGENTNRGNGIIVCLELNEIKAILKRQQKHSDGTLKTYILQKYIERPLLYKKRKFDLRHYIMMNCSNGKMKGYWYNQGYVRTTSTQYTLKQSFGGVHLTNDSVQKNLPDYGKYEKANKISYEQLDTYMKTRDKKFDFFNNIIPKMKQIATNIIQASAMNIDPERRINNFEIFGLDFMIDVDYDVWLIQVNTNPCLENSCNVLNKIVPMFIQNTFRYLFWISRICVDPVFGPPLGYKGKYQGFNSNVHEQNGYQLVFDERVSGVKSIGASVVASGVEQQDDVFEDDGQDFDDEL